MATVTEIAPDIFRICTYFTQNNLEFNEFIVRDEQPLLFHTGPRKTFGEVCEGVRQVMDPAKIRWVGFSHFEADECGALNEWLAVAPDAQALCSKVAANVSVNDFADRPARPLNHDEILLTGRYRFRFLRTPHVPHAWEAGLIFEETERILFTSDLFHQSGRHQPLTESDVVAGAADTLRKYQSSPMANSIPYTPYTEPILAGLAELKPATLAIMHGPSYRGDGAAAIKALAAAAKEILAGDAKWRT
ncbi:MAG: MBL fold metallo-hydrolase [Candidatus Binataceae bacterium]